MSKILYVLKTHYGAYIAPHSNGKEVNYCILPLEDAYKYDKTKLLEMYSNFKKDWDKEKWEVYEVYLDEIRRKNWIDN